MPFADPADDLPAADLTVSLAAPDMVQLRFELGTVIDSAAGPLPPGMSAADAGRWLGASGDRPAGRVSGEGTTFQAVDELVRSPLAPLFAGDAAPVGDAGRWSVTVDGEAAPLDAGDWDRRTQHLEASRRLSELAELEPGFAGAGALDANIPGSGNALPDVVEEALWGLSIFLDLQDAGGGVSGGVRSRGDRQYGEGSFSESQGVHAYAPDPWTTWEFAAASAKAAFVLEAYDPDLAATYREAALRAMDWAEARTDQAELDRPVVLEARDVTAAELHRLTGDEAWGDLYLETASHTQALADIDFREHQFEAAFTYARTERAGVDEGVAARGVEYLADEARDLTEVYDGAAFGQTYNPFAPYGFGKSFSQPSDAADLYVRPHALTGEARCLTPAEESVQFALGANPLNLSFVTGLEGPDGAARGPEERLVVDADMLGVGPPPGIVAHGTHDAGTYPGFWTGVIEPTIFPDAREWPVLESFDAYFFAIPATEFTVQQGMAELTYVTGYVAAQDGRAASVAEPPPPPTVELEGGAPRNTVTLDERDLLVRGFDVDGGGEGRLDTFVLALPGEGSRDAATTEDWLDLIGDLAAGASTGARREGTDLSLEVGGRSATFVGLLGPDLPAGEVDPLLGQPGRAHGPGGRRSPEPPRARRARAPDAGGPSAPACSRAAPPRDGPGRRACRAGPRRGRRRRAARRSPWPARSAAPDDRSRCAWRAAAPSSAASPDR